ncbi:S-layer homology domain-containing protein [Paenibacillus silvisoli]|uniref:S-layer homology domain-containing protein n=1 Tax=Paenibacillus silvisoli TaxID=3110539 RepID=UPI002804026A|nr:S-layer homology domain-containing protein [Paenibacillus silvisoli]
MPMHGLMKPGQAANQAGAEFADIGKASAWAIDAIRGAQALGLVSGKGEGEFDPKGAVTRAETAKMIVEMLAKK